MFVIHPSEYESVAGLWPSFVIPLPDINPNEELPLEVPSGSAGVLIVMGTQDEKDVGCTSKIM